MPASASLEFVNDAFFQPLQGLIAASSHGRPCGALSDEQYLHLGIHRVLESARSGRAFLPEHALRWREPPEHFTYFAALHSERRRDLLVDVNRALLTAVVLPERMDLPELEKYECFALDGHWHRAATHVPRHGGAKPAVGHFYSLNLQTHLLRHLVVGEGLHEHDRSVRKRLKPPLTMITGSVAGTNARCIS